MFAAVFIKKKQLYIMASLIKAKIEEIKNYCKENGIK